MGAADLKIECPEGEPVIRFERQVAAPPATVFEVWTVPDHLKHWWGPARNTLEECEVDLRVGGTHRYVARNAEGAEFRFHGEFLEVAPPHRLVSTWVFDGVPDEMTVDTLVFEPNGEGTLVRGESRVDSVELRDRRRADERMLEGMNETWDRLDSYLHRLQAGLPGRAGLTAT